MSLKIMASRLSAVLLLGLLVLLPPALASGQEEQKAEEQATEAEGQATEAEGQAAEAEGQATEAEEPVKEAEAPVKLIKMYAEEWKWTPNLIRVTQGTRLKIEFLSYGASRRFDLEGYKLKVHLPQDKPVSVEFVADKKGTFRWRCGRPCGNGCAKMTGKLIVE